MAALELPTHLFFSWGGSKNEGKAQGSVRGHILYLPLYYRHSTLHVDFLLWEACGAFSHINVLPAVFRSHCHSNGVSMSTLSLYDYTSSIWIIIMQTAQMLNEFPTNLCIFIWHKRDKCINSLVILFIYLFLNRHQNNFPWSHQLYNGVCKKYYSFCCNLIYLA